jgi:pilus assembly protein Flp/PilA
MDFIKNFIREEEGQGLVEYGIILGLVSVAAIAVLGTMAGDLDGVFGAINAALAPLG